MGKLSSITISAYVVLVSTIILTFVEFSQSCHRRVEYHHFYKKQPHKGQGHEHGGGGYGGGHGGGYGQQQHGHGGGYGYGGQKGYGGGGGHKGYSQGHGSGYGNSGHKGYGGGGGGGHKGYGGGGGHKGYSQGHGSGHGGGGHKGYGQSQYGGGGHAQQYGHGGGGHGQYVGGAQHGHGGGGHKGYGGSSGGGHYGGVYGMPHGHEYGGGSHGHQGDEGYGHEMYGYGMGHHEPHGHDAYGQQDEGYGHGQNDAYGGGHEQSYGQDKGHGGGHGSGGGNGAKGHKFKYHMYESSHYNDKGGHQPSPHNSYSHSAPLYMQKGYGYSGPYPNTEYSSPVEASVNAPTVPRHPNSFSGDDDIEEGIEGGRLPPHLDAADTADLIRNVFNTKEPNPIGNFAGAAGSVRSSHLSDDASITGLQSNAEYNAVDALAAFTAEIPPSDNSGGESLTETKVSPTSMSNFDLNLNFNSDLPAPFRRNLFESALGSTSGGRIRKKLSSKYRDNPADILGLEDSSDISQSQPVSNEGGPPPGPDYLENDTSGSSSVLTKTSAEPADNSKMNF